MFIQGIGTPRKSHKCDHSSGIGKRVYPSAANTRHQFNRRSDPGVPNNLGSPVSKYINMGINIPRKDVLQASSINWMNVILMQGEELFSLLIHLTEVINDDFPPVAVGDFE